MIILIYYYAATFEKMLYFGDFKFFCSALKSATLMYKVIEIFNDGAIVDIQYNGSFLISLYIQNFINE